MSPDEEIDLINPSVMARLITAITLHEGGSMPYDDSMVMLGIALMNPALAVKHPKQ